MPKDKDLDLNSSADLPQGSSSQGATRNSLGGYKMADLQRGFGDGEYLPPQSEDDGTTGMCCLDDDQSKTKGFLSRPEGWER